MKSRSSPSSPQASPAIAFKDKTVVITGAGAGLGRSYALMFGKLGANVVINDVTKEGADKVVEEVKTGESPFREINEPRTLLIIQLEVRLLRPFALPRTEMLSSKLPSMPLAPYMSSLPMPVSSGTKHLSTWTRRCGIRSWRYTSEAPSR